MDVAAGGDVVVVFRKLGMIDDAAEFCLFFPADEDVGDTLDIVVRDEVLGVALFEDLAGVDEEDPALSVPRFVSVEEEDDARGGGVVEQVFGQVEDTLDEVVVNEPPADGFFLVGAGIARAARGGASVEDDGGAACGIEAGVHVLDPAPVGGGFAGEAGPGGEAVEFVVVVVGFGVFALIPHGVGDDAVEGAELALFVAESGVPEGVADLDLALHVVDDHVHVGHGPSFGDVFLTKQLQRSAGFLTRVRVFFSLSRVRKPALLFVRVFIYISRVGKPALLFDLAFHEEAAGAATGVVDFHAGPGLDDPGHDAADRGRGVELAGALAAALGELTDEVFVAFADDVGLDVGQPEAFGADGLDEIGEAVVVEVALAVGGGVEVDAVNDALQERVFPGDGTYMGGDAFADPVGELADDGPDGLFRVVRYEGEVEANELGVAFDQPECFHA